MVYKIKDPKGDWTLHKRDVKLKGQKTRPIFFFSRKKPKSGTPCDKPDGYTVGKNKKTGLPFLKKK